MPLAAAPTVEFSGYADVRAMYTMGDTKEFALAIGRMELTADALILPWLSLEVTLGTYGTMDTPRDYKAELGGAFVSLFKEDDGTKMSLNIGYFDTPFGLASGWYAFPENSFMYHPGVTEYFLGEWTDLGMYGAIEAEQYSVSAFVVQGEMEYLVDLYGGEGKGIAGGLRATFSPIEGLTLGVSYALNGHAVRSPTDESNNFSLIAGDIEWALGPLSLAFQYTASMPKFKFSDRLDVWFAQAMFSLEEIADVPIEFGARFDYFTGNYVTALSGGTPEDATNILTIQANWLLDEHLRIGLSFRHEKDEDDVLMLQVMGMF